MSYKESLNLPSTGFPMRANLAKREVDFQAKWEKERIYEQALSRRRSMKAPLFVLHDGPPYANGDIHIGTALNKILKDIINRFRALAGYETPYLPGWDTHGLPIEHQVTKELGKEKEKLDPLELRQKCKSYALMYVDRQKEQFKRLGVWGEWENPYLTLTPGYEAKQIEIFGEMAKKGLLYKGKKPVYWCSDCGTALAEAEVEYRERRSPSIFVRFPLVEDAEVNGIKMPASSTSFLIWTTTPWTIPANMAIALHPSFQYSLVKAGEEQIIMASALVDEVLRQGSVTSYEILGTFAGRDLEGIKTGHPFYDRLSPTILGRHVTLEQGSGCVHTAPGHGHDDFIMGQQYDLPIWAPMDEKGRFTEESGPFAGLSYNEVNKEVTKRLKEDGLLFFMEFIEHQYPHCWRCKEPILFLATKQWFASVEAIKEDTLKAIDEVTWYPSWGRERMRNMVLDRTDWCISRQKVWGVPIPAFYCQDCEREIIEDKTIEAVRDLFAREGSDAWFKYSAEEILPDDYSCPHCQRQSGFTKETDIMDVWFDSGTSYAAVLEVNDHLRYPSDLYLEGTDQFRGWFNSSLLTSVATRGQAPYYSVLSNGFTVDERGEKMSKSQGNVVNPLDMISRYGADILRLWVTSSDFKSDMRVSESILKQNSEVYRRIRNTCRFILGNLYDFHPDEDMVPYEDLSDLDQYALYTLQKLISRSHQAFLVYEFHQFYHGLHNFCAVEMSSFYLDIIKDRLYTMGADSLERRRAQTVIFQVISALATLMAPVLPHTAEEVWSFMPQWKEKGESVFLTDWPVIEAALPALKREEWEALIGLRKDVSKALEVAREGKEIGNSLGARVEIHSPSDFSLEGREAFLSDFFIVSQVDLKEDADGLEAGRESGFYLRVLKARGGKCERCWKHDEIVREEGKTICHRCQNVMESL